ncbi:hypothetical protein MUO93_06795 [Candidatus Bathyarchaeota archaeon]|nr:hypothetical protein [Candidatus Bathyarchaeota archaeon]
MSKLFLEEIDTEALFEEQRQRWSKQLKRALIKEGRDKILSIYGAVYKKDGDVFQARRIEVLSPTEWTRDRLISVELFFHNTCPPYVYSIWEINEGGTDLRCLGGYN